MRVTLTDEQVEWFRESIDLMNSIYGDESRMDWFDGDDVAKNIADELDAILLQAAEAEDEK